MIYMIWMISTIRSNDYIFSSMTSFFMINFNISIFHVFSKRRTFLVRRICHCDAYSTAKRTPGRRLAESPGRPVAGLLGRQVAGSLGRRVAGFAGSPGRQVAGSPRRQVASVSDCALRAPWSAAIEDHDVVINKNCTMKFTWPKWAIKCRKIVITDFSELREWFEICFPMHSKNRTNKKKQVGKQLFWVFSDVGRVMNPTVRLFQNLSACQAFSKALFLWSFLFTYIQA